VTTPTPKGALAVALQSAAKGAARAATEVAEQIGEFYGQTAAKVEQAVAKTVEKDATVAANYKGVGTSLNSLEAGLARNGAVQQEFQQLRQQLKMPSLAEQKLLPKGAKKYTLGKMEFDNGQTPLYGQSGRMASRTDAYPGAGNGIARTSWDDHAEGDLLYQAQKNGYSGGNATIYTDTPTCQFCQNSMSGYAGLLNLDTLTVYDSNGLVGVWNQAGKIK
jgi:hypothetical protein